MRYCRGVDRRDRSLIEGAFHPGAIQDYGHTQRTAPELAELMLALPATDRSNHFVGNELIEVDGDSATCEVSFISIWELTRNGKEYTRMRGGRYLDRCERRDGVWRIAHRQTVDDWSRLDELVARPEGVAGLAGGFWPDDLVYRLQRSYD